LRQRQLAVPVSPADRNGLGRCVGALVLSVMRNGMTILGIQSYLQQIVEGVVIIVAVILDMRKNARKA
jgi:inositol transport system permease protein